MTETLLSAKDLPELYGQLTERIAQITGGRACLIAQYDSVSKSFVTQLPTYRAKERDGLPLIYKVNPEKHKLWNFRLQGTLLSNNAATDPRVDNYFAKNYKAKSCLISPMIVQNKLMGLIVIMNKPKGFTEFDSYLASLIGFQAGVIISNALLMEDEKRRVKQIALLNETARSINSSLVLEDILQRAMDAVVSILKKNEVGVYIPNEERTRVHLIACCGPLHKKIMEQGYVQSVDRGLIGMAFQKASTVYSNDCKNDPRFLVHPMIHTNSEVCIPVKRENYVLALINVESPEINGFSSYDILFLETLADQLAVAFHNATVYQRERKYRNQMHLLSELISELALVLDVKLIAKTTVERIKQRFEYYFVAFGWVDEERRVIKDWYYLPRFPQLEQPSQTEEFPFDSGLVGLCARTGKTVVVQDVTRSQDYFNVLPDVKSEMVTPVKVGDSVVALLDLQTVRMNGFDESDQTIMETLAHALSTTIQNANSYHRLERINTKLAETSRMKDEIVQIVAHDFRSPLTVIRGYMDYLLKKGEWKDEKQKEIMNTVSLQALRLQKLAEATLKASRLDSGDISYSFEKLDFVSFIQRLIFPWSEKHKFVVDVTNNLPLIKADAGRLQEVIENLVSNAIKYSPDGGKIEILATRVKASDLPVELGMESTADLLKVCVSDEGIGIPPEKRDLLFQRFSRVHENRRIEGIGLGLYIAKKMVDMHGGRIWVEPLAKGTRFCFAIPAFEETVSEDNIMLVDDDVNTLRILHKTISELGYEVVTATDGNEALEKLRRFRPLLIILDVLMPGMDGLELLHRLRENPETEAIPVIVFTGKNDVFLPRELGAVSVVSKNAGVSALKACIEQVLKQR